MSPPDSSCSWNQFACSANKCISKQWTCDGEDDCGDGLDESDAICGEWDHFCSGLGLVMINERPRGPRGGWEGDKDRIAKECEGFPPSAPSYQQIGSFLWELCDLCNFISKGMNGKPAWAKGQPSCSPVPILQVKPLFEFCVSVPGAQRP